MSAARRQFPGQATCRAIRMACKWSTTDRARIKQGNIACDRESFTSGVRMRDGPAG